MKSPEGLPLDCTIEDVWRHRQVRANNDADFQHAYILPDLSQDPAEVYEYLVDAEKQIIPNGDYDKGSASYDNEILVIEGISGVLLTAEHATSHFRVKESGIRLRKLHDGGTAALGITVSNDTSSIGLIPSGRQTGDANLDKKHPIKDKISQLIGLQSIKTHLSIHGMVRAHASEIRDIRGFSVLMGIGTGPSEATLTLKDTMLEIGKDLGLRVEVNKPHIKINVRDQKPVLLDEHTLATQVYSASTLATRGWSETEAKRLGKSDSFAAIQVELSDVLRVHPWEEETITFPTRRDREIGAYLGYHFLRAATNNASIIS